MTGFAAAFQAAVTHYGNQRRRTIVASTAAARRAALYLRRFVANVVEALEAMLSAFGRSTVTAELVRLAISAVLPLGITLPKTRHCTTQSEVEAKVVALTKAAGVVAPCAALQSLVVDVTGLVHALAAEAVAQSTLVRGPLSLDEVDVTAACEALGLETACSTD